MITGWTSERPSIDHHELSHILIRRAHLDAKANCARRLVELVSLDAYLQMTDIVEIIVLEEGDALQTQQRLQTMLRIPFEQPAKQVFRRVVQFTLGQHSRDVVDWLLLVLFDGTARVVDLIEIFELVFVVVFWFLER